MPAPGKIKSKRQQGFLFANYPKAARKWAHNLSTNKSDWKRSGKKRRTRGRKRGGRGRRRR